MLNGWRIVQYLIRQIKCKAQSLTFKEYKICNISSCNASFLIDWSFYGISLRITYLFMG